MVAPVYPRTIGRYVINAPIASGGMATIHLGRLVGPVGFSRMVAIKRLHEHLSHDPEFVQMFLDEARIAARIQHPNVVSTIDIVELDDELFLVMDYIQGESLSHFIKRARNHDTHIPPNIAIHVMVGVLHGLHAAHEAKDEKGQPLGIIHRDVTPQNVLVGVDGVPRIADFGIATAAGRLHHTREGQIKGKVQYMAPEQLTSKPTDRRCDIYAASVVLWESLTGQKLFAANTDAQIMYKVLEGKTERPSSLVKGLPLGLDAIIVKGLQKDPSKRYATAEEMAVALEKVMPPATASAVGAWVREQAAETLANAAVHIQEAERTSPNERAIAIAQYARVHSPSLPTSPAIEISPYFDDPAPAKPPRDPLPPPVPEAAPPSSSTPAIELSEEIVVDSLRELPPPGVAAPLEGAPVETPPHPAPPAPPAPPAASPFAPPVFEAALAPPVPLDDALAVLDASMAVPDETPVEEPLYPPPRQVSRHQKLVLGVIAGAGFLLLGGLIVKSAAKEEPDVGATSLQANATAKKSSEPPTPPPAMSHPLPVDTMSEPAPPTTPEVASSPAVAGSAPPSASALAVPAPKYKKPKNKLYSRD